MRPPFSMILFTVLAGTAQGLMLALCGVELFAPLLVMPLDRTFFIAGAVCVLALSGAGLVCATFHLGRPERAWRAMAMWRTSWLSREVIVLPAFMLAVALWGALHWTAGPGAGTRSAGLAAAGLALLLYLCTGMIYAAVKVIREWATPLTPVSFALMGLACGSLLACVLSAAWAAAWTGQLAQTSVLLTVLAAIARGWQLLRNHTQAGATSVQTAIGVRHPRIVQTSNGTMAGSFGTREFFHGKPANVVRNVRGIAVVLGFVLPLAVLCLAVPGASALAGLCLLQNLGMLAERWVFFAEARHPQNLYQQACRAGRGA